jgi:group I intron endonuclease
MKDLTGVYKIISPNKKIYIGSSIHILKRLNQHKKKSSNKELRNSIDKYGWDNHRILLLKICSKDELKDVEYQIINEHNIKGDLLMNQDLRNYSKIKQIAKESSYLNISRMSEITGISYDRINRAVRWGIVGVFNTDEKMKLVRASMSLLEDHVDTHEQFKQMLWGTNEH